MEETAMIERLVKQKLAAFDRLQAEFEECFRYMQDVHGQQRFPTFSVSDADAVHYLHALWTCECKVRFLIFTRISGVTKEDIALNSCKDGKGVILPMWWTFFIVNWICFLSPLSRVNSIRLCTMKTIKTWPTQKT